MTSTLSAVFVAPIPSNAKPTVDSIAAAAASVSVTVICVALVIMAEVISPTAKVIPAVVSPSASMSQTSLDQSSEPLTSVEASAIVVKLLPEKII